MTFNLRRIGALVLAGALLAGCGASGSREGQSDLPPVLVQKGDPVLPAASGYVGSVTCGSCHPGIYAEWGNTLHNKPLKTVAEVGDAAFVNDADGNGVNDFKDGLDLAGNVNFSAYGSNAPKLSIEGGKYFMTIGAVRYEIQRVQGGNGYWKQRYQTRVGRSYYLLPVQYNEVQKTYTVYNGSNWYDGSNAPRFTAAYGFDALVVQMDALNNGIDLKGTAVSWENRCAGCHQTGLVVQVDTASYGGTPVKEVVTGYVELNIGCEACHGPGAAHAASHDPADILNPADFLAGGVAGVKRANEVCGSCHSRGASIALPGMSLGMEAPALLSGSAAIPFLPGNNLLNDLLATGAYVTLTTTVSNFWGSVHFAAADVNAKFPLYTASKSHHQQYMDIGQGPHAADKPYDVPCFGCHSPHSAANRHMIATTVKEGGVTKVTGTKEENNTLCLACHATFGDFSGITTADVQALADLGASSSVDTALLGHMIRRANMDVPIDLGGTGAGRCTACHMPKTARSAAYTSSFLDADGKQKGDIRSHTMKVVLPNTNVRDVTSTFFNTSATDNSVSTSMPNGCSACHKASDTSSTTPGDYEMYGWARSGHADYLDKGVGGYTDRLDRSAAKAAGYNSTSNADCVSCHTGAGYVDNLAGSAPTAHFIPPTEKNFLNCTTCHDSAAPAANQHVRQIGTVVFPSGLSVTTGGNSKVCFKCHAGRNSKASVDAAVPVGGVFNFGDVDPHFLPAAALLHGPLARGGYEYAGKDYSNILSGVHIFASCVTCHMAAGPAANWNVGGHALAMTDGPAQNTTACSSFRCHGPVTSFDVRGTNPQGTLNSLLALLDTALAAKGVVKADPFVYPYFTNITTQAELRAAYNYRFVSADPGAHVHNWWYAAQLLYDSLNDLDNTVVFPGNKTEFFR
ncbi:cytochrome c3 family protein [Candidatus Deferrimicrobium sp.]|uniref:cytochrome c3 family protein n=1 Tax=Candidatus Deferrimicrobium sp. TaxID=3060586 RepID=UPI0027194170|nr:multiheme c-type cytochrome [Candidatus Deferrimicrobium sp.]MDO8739522.1 cytochrome c3 family protein [Candidatus Deferrimicrobium sp.]